MFLGGFLVNLNTPMEIEGEMKTDGQTLGQRPVHPDALEDGAVCVSI